MKIPLSWLSEYVETPSDLTPEQLHEDLVRVGFEEEEIFPQAVTGPLVVGKVLSFVDEPQNNGKTIRWCQVQVSQNAEESDPSAVRGIVCGANNFAEGDKVVVALPGSVLPGNFEISARKTYGHISDGMMASARELGLGDDHDGIIVLSRFGLDPEIGSDAKALLGLNDSAIEINVTTDRGYALSIRGIAREYSHATGAKFTDPALRKNVPQLEGFSVDIDDEAPLRGVLGCDVFVTRLVKNVDTTVPTPPWMISRLQLAGIRSISLVVDITNYVMLEFGQPIHAYDFDKLTGGITVRRAKLGEKLTTLDDQVRDLSDQDLVIADESGAIGLAGVMGGASTEIQDDTKDVLIEAAHFEPVTVMRTARRHKLHSEASKRFERGVDATIQEAAADRVVELLVLLAGAEATDVGTFIDLAEPLANIVLPKGYAQSRMGVEYSSEQIVDTLTAIGATILDVNDNRYLVQPPAWRKDLVAQEDLVEEIGRIVGYDQIPSVLPTPPAGKGLTLAQRKRKEISNALAAWGLTEVITFPFLGPGENARFAGEIVPEEKGKLKEYVSSIPEVRLANALDGEAPFLRRTLLPGLLKLAHRNAGRGLNDIQVFEQGSVFLPEADTSYGHAVLPVGGVALDQQTYEQIQSALVPQKRHLAVLFLGNTVDAQPGQPAVAANWQDVISAAQVLGLASGNTIKIRQGEHPAMHPGRCAILSVKNAEGELIDIGVAGEVLPSLLQTYHLPRTVPYLEIDLDLLIELSDDRVQATSLRTMSAATQDISLVVDESIPAADIRDVFAEGAGELLEDIRLAADYRGEGIEQGKKSLTFALRFRAEDRTLTAQEATDAKMAGLEAAAAQFDATMRQ